MERSGWQFLPDDQKEALARTGQGFLISGWRLRSIAAIYQAPSGSPRRWDQSPHIAAAIAKIGWAAGEEPGTAPGMMPSVMPSTVPTVTAPGGSGGRRQRRRTQRCRGDCNKREFA